MGKGDVKTKRGKITKGTFGNLRPKKKKKVADAKKAGGKSSSSSKKK